jgi:hypothetical protein
MIRFCAAPLGTARDRPRHRRQGVCRERARERGPKMALACVDLRLIRPDKHSLEFANPIIDGTVNHSLRMWWRIASCFATFVRRP